MPRDRRRPPGFEAWLLSPLPWAWQERIPHRAVSRVLYLLGGLALVGPWPFAVWVIGGAVWMGLRQGRRLAEGRARHREGVAGERAIWIVQVTEGWRWKLLLKAGILWLPARVPMLEGDLFLMDIRGAGDRSPPVYRFGGRLANPTSASPRRRRRIVRLAAWWTLECPLPLSDLPATAAAVAGGSGGSVRVVEAQDEGTYHLYHRLTAKVSLREARKLTWRHERKVHRLFHQLWSSQGPGAKYDKAKWCELQGELQRAGILV